MATIELKKFAGDPREDQDQPYYFFPDPREKFFDEDESGELSALTKKERDKMRIMKKSMPLTYLKEKAQEGEATAKLYNDFFYFIPLLVLVVVSASLERSTSELYWITQAIGLKSSTDEIAPPTLDGGPTWGKSFMDIETNEAFGQWATTVLIPLFYNADDPNERVYTNNYFQGYNLKVGSLRFRIQRVVKDSCKLNDKWIPANSSIFPQECYAEYSDDDRDVSDFGPYKYHTCFSNLERTSGERRTWDCSGIVYDIPFSYSRNMALQEVNNLISANFLDPTSVRFFMLSAITYNPSMDTFSLLQDFIEVAEGGFMKPQSRIIHYRLFHPTNSIDLFLLLVWVLFLTVRFLWHWIRAVRKDRGLNFFMQLWNFVDCINFIFFFCYFGARFAWWSRTDNLDFKLPTSEAEEGYNSNLETAAQMYNLGVFFFAVNIVLTLLSVLKYASLNPRLNIMTRSLATAAQDMIGLLVLFFTVILAYSLCGLALFGSGMEDFRTVAIAFSTLMRMLLGDSDYEAMRRENLHLAGLFFWSFLVLGLFLLLNFIVALIGSAFNKESSKTRAKPLLQQITDLLKAIKKALVRFFTHPIDTITGAYESGSQQFAKHGRYRMIWMQLDGYRGRLPLVGISPEDFAQLPEEERAEFLPDPEMIRKELSLIFSVEKDGLANLALITETFLNDFWIDAWHEYKFCRDEDTEAKNERRKKIKEIAEKNLKTVLGMSGGEPIDDAISVRQLFAPTNDTLDSLKVFEDRVLSLETTLARVAGKMGKMDAVVQLVEAKKRGCPIRSEANESQPATALPRQVPKTQLTPL